MRCIPGGESRSPAGSQLEKAAPGLCGREAGAIQEGLGFRPEDGPAGPWASRGPRPNWETNERAGLRFYTPIAPSPLPFLFLSAKDFLDYFKASIMKFLLLKREQNRIMRNKTICHE